MSKLKQGINLLEKIFFNDYLMQQSLIFIQP